LVLRGESGSSSSSSSNTLTLCFFTSSYSCFFDGSLIVPRVFYFTKAGFFLDNKSANVFLNSLSAPLPTPFTSDFDLNRFCSKSFLGGTSFFGSSFFASGKLSATGLLLSSGVGVSSSGSSSSSSLSKSLGFTYLALSPRAF
jgi:hypothetical protein